MSICIEIEQTSSEKGMADVFEIRMQDDFINFYLESGMDSIVGEIAVKDAVTLAKMILAKY